MLMKLTHGRSRTESFFTVTQKVVLGQSAELQSTKTKYWKYFNSLSTLETEIYIFTEISKLLNGCLAIPLMHC